MISYTKSVPVKCFAPFQNKNSNKFEFPQPIYNI